MSWYTGSVRKSALLFHKPTVIYLYMADVLSMIDFMSYNQAQSYEGDLKVKHLLITLYIFPFF